MTNGSRTGSGTRVERHDPLVVAKTIAAKRRDAMQELAETEVKQISRVEAARLNSVAKMEALEAAAREMLAASKRYDDALEAMIAADDELEEAQAEEKKGD